MKELTTAIFSFLFSLTCLAQDNTSSPPAENNEDNPCITATQYELIEKRCNENIKLLKLKPVTRVGVTLNWPLKQLSGFTDCSYYFISAYVDQDATTGIKDWHCGNNTYDTHRGTDIATYPFPFYKMDSSQVEVIAAAPGTIIDKSDGNFDKNCGTNTLTANYIVIQHADGSEVLYFHMKKNSLTAKGIGETVVSGEYLGVVGSSGNASGPHLHFEVRTGTAINTTNDPFGGTCNTLNANSWWASQKEYTEPSLLKVLVSTTDIVIPACPSTETINEENVFAVPFQGTGLPAGYAKFYIFLRNETNGMTADVSILNPDNSVFNSWTYVSTSDNKVRTQGWSKKLPLIAGIYTFKSTYNGITCSKSFEITTATSVSPVQYPLVINIYPNPSSGSIILESANEPTGKETIEFYNVLGEKVFEAPVSHRKSEVELNITAGIYLYKVKENKKVISTGKLIIE